MAPRYAKVGRALIEGVRNETVVQDPAAQSRFKVRPRGIVDAVRRAREEQTPEAPALRGGSAAAALLALLVLCLGAGALRGGLEPLPLLPYALSAVAAWLVWRRDGLRESRLALAVFGGMIALQAALPSGWIALQLPLVLVVAGLFFVRSRIAGVLLLAWAFKGAL
jgi:hypothetical protein